jgi:CheY-like chemotaxis protein
VSKIDVVNDGEQALNYLHPEITEAMPGEMPRLVLLDLKLPKVDGITVLEKIRADPRTHDLIVVVMTSSAENQDLSACYRLGVNSYVVKPLDFQQFMELAQHVGIYWMTINQVPQNS